MSIRVPVEDADALDVALRARDDAVCELRGEDGRFLVVLSQVHYVKRYAREARVGFPSRRAPWASRSGSSAYRGRARRPSQRADASRALQRTMRRRTWAWRRSPILGWPTSRGSTAGQGDAGRDPGGGRSRHGRSAARQPAAGPTRCSVSSTGTRRVRTPRAISRGSHSSCSLPTAITSRRGCNASERRRSRATPGCGRRRPRSRRC